MEQSLGQSFVLVWELLLEQGSAHLQRERLVRPLVDSLEKWSQEAEKLSLKVKDLNYNLDSPINYI